MLTCALLLSVEQHLEHKPQIWQLEILVMCVFTAQCSLYDICDCALYVQVIMMTIIRTFNGCSFLETNARYITNNTVLWFCCLFLYCTFLRLTVQRLWLTVQRLGLIVRRLGLQTDCAKTRTDCAKTRTDCAKTLTDCTKTLTDCAETLTGCAGLCCMTSSSGFFCWLCSLVFSTLVFVLMSC